MGTKPLGISFDKVDGFIKIYDGTIYLVLFGLKRYDAIDDRIRYLIIEKVVLHIVLIIILQESELIHVILYLYNIY